MFLSYINKNKQIILLLFIVLALAGFFRVWQLDSIPPGIYPDEAINANQAITESGKIFYPENNGREGFYINLIAMSFSVFGISIWSFKIVSAIIGILTVLGLYLLVLELFGKNKTPVILSQQAKNPAELPRDTSTGFFASLRMTANAKTLNATKYQFIALCSCFFMATSFWHINFSRIGFRAILVPFVLVFSFYFLFKGFREKKIWHFILAGLIFGLGFHTYIAFRVAVLLVLAILFFYLLISIKQKTKKQFFIFASCFLLFVFIAALPIGIYFLQNPADFMGRAGGVSIFTQDSPIKALGISIVSHLAMFNFFGDYNWRHNISGSPILFWPVGIFFLIGFILCIKNALKHLIQTIQKKIASQVPSSKFQVPSFMILWFFVMLLPGFLSSEGTPHCLRCIGAIPVVFIFAGIGAEFLYSRLKKFLPNQNIDVWRHSDRAPFANGAREESRQRRNSTGFFAPLRMTANAKILKLFIIFAGTLLMISFTYAQYHRYFILWGQNTETQRAFSCNCVAIGNYLNTLPDNAEKYVIINESGPHIPLPIETIKFIRATKGETRLGPAPCEGPDYGVANQNTNYIFLEQIKDIEITDKQAYIILMDKNQNLLNEIQTIFPEGKIIKTSEVWGYDL